MRLCVIIFAGVIAIGGARVAGANLKVKPLKNAVSWWRTGNEHFFMNKLLMVND
jgi:hypothetical protein